MYDCHQCENSDGSSCEWFHGFAYAAGLPAEQFAGLSGTLLSNQAQIRDRRWFLPHRGQKIDVFVLGRLLKLDLSTSTPVDTWCPVVGHTKIKVEALR